MLVPTLVSVAAATAAVLVLLLVALIRNLRAVSDAIHRLQSEMLPALEEIQRDAERTRERLDRMARTQGRTPG
jgi:uncharacterized protein YoxC